MKKILPLLLCMLTLSSCLGEIPVSSKPETESKATAATPYSAVNYSYMKGIWLSQYDMRAVYTDGGTQRERQDFVFRMGEIFDNVKKLGFNTVIIQVRPFGDSFYPSEYYPMSSFAVGAYGEGADYDPFDIAVEQAHERGLSVHAWINPLRAMRADEIYKIDRKYAVRAWYDGRSGYVKEVSGRLYLDPAYPETRKLVTDGVRELIRNYPVDGIHIDDYFYPTTEESFDRAAYNEYLLNGGNKTRADFRRDNINSLIREIYSAVKEENDSVLFGVSPSGVMKNNYETLYADVAEWCSNEGYLDYICPQVYFGFEHSTCAFDKVCGEFAALVKNDKVKLVIGMSLGKAEAEYDPYAGEGKYEWRDSKDILRRSFLYTLSIPECSGVSLFSYQHFYDPVSGRENEKTAREREGLVPLIKARR